ncbi:MAG: dihydrofolate reductase family protein [Chloroflexota bacterium]
MTIKCSVYIAASVDGFIAGPDGEIDWLHRPEYDAPEAGDYGYEAFISTVDALVMGRHSYEKVRTFEEWPYGEMTVVVLSSQMVEIPPALEGKVIAEQGAPQEIVARLEEKGVSHLYIDGGVTIQRFLRAGLIDQMIVTRIPVLLGRGIPLFGSVGTEIPLKHVRTESFENGFVQSHYEIVVNDTS